MFTPQVEASMAKLKKKKGEIIISTDTSNPNIPISKSSLEISPFQKLQTLKFSINISQNTSSGNITSLTATPIGLTISLSNCDISQYTSPLPELRLYRIDEKSNNSHEVTILNYTNIQSLIQGITIHGTSTLIGNNANPITLDDGTTYPNQSTSSLGHIKYNITTEHTLTEFNKIRLASSFNGVLNIKLLLITSS